MRNGTQKVLCTKKSEAAGVYMSGMNMYIFFSFTLKLLFLFSFLINEKPILLVVDNLPIANKGRQKREMLKINNRVRGMKKESGSVTISYQPLLFSLLFYTVLNNFHVYTNEVLYFSAA